LPYTVAEACGPASPAVSGEVILLAASPLGGPGLKAPKASIAATNHTTSSRAILFMFGHPSLSAARQVLCTACTKAIRLLTAEHRLTSMFHIS
jgi:hypothetical protein